MTTVKEKPETLLQAIWDDLKSLTENLENGGNLDMSPLNTKVKDFCDELKTLPPIEAKSYQNKLSEITTNLSELVARMVEKQGAIREQIDSLNQRKRANNAYGSSSMLNKDGNK